MSTILIKNRLHEAFETLHASVRDRYPNGLFKNASKDEELGDEIEQIENWEDSAAFQAESQVENFEKKKTIFLSVFALGILFLGFVVFYYSLTSSGESWVGQANESIEQSEEVRTGLGIEGRSTNLVII